MEHIGVKLSIPIGVAIMDTTEGVHLGRVGCDGEKWSRHLD